MQYILLAQNNVQPQKRITFVMHYFASIIAIYIYPMFLKQLLFVVLEENVKELYDPVLVITICLVFYREQISSNNS
jgi:hypothetical protein